MIYINKPINTPNISYVICDFDHTITSLDSPSSWSIYAASPLLSDELKSQLNTCYNKYRPIELNHLIPDEERIKILRQWPIEEMSYLAMAGITKELFDTIALTTPSLSIRPDFPNFVYNMERLGIPIYIVSGGLYEPIKATLEKEGALRSNVTIITNHVKVCDGKITGLESPVLYTYNKDIINLPITPDEVGLSFGDLPSDKKVGLTLKKINIAFLNHANLKLYNQTFDITLTDASSFDQIGKHFFKQYKK